MLVKLSGGVAVDPAIVKYIQVRRDQRAVDGAPTTVYTVAIKLDDDSFVPIRTFDDFDEAEALANRCADKINKALGEEPPGDDDEDFGDDEGGEAPEDDDDDEGDGGDDDDEGDGDDDFDLDAFLNS